MVKIDYTQDYYADLEVGPSAGLEDIRKSYRKLGELSCPQQIPLNLLTILCFQPSDTTPTATPVARSRQARGSRSSRPPTRYSPMMSKGKNTTALGGPGMVVPLASRATLIKTSQRTILLHLVPQVSRPAQPRNVHQLHPPPTRTPNLPKMCQRLPRDLAGSRPSRHSHGKLGSR